MCREHLPVWQQFYEKLISTREIPTTAAPPPGVYDDVYRRLIRDAEEIVSIHLASRYSGLYSSASVAARELSETRIAVIDSEQVTMGYGWMVVAAAEAAQRGASLEEIVSLVEGMKPRTRVLAALGTLEYLHRGGRVDWIQAVIGTLHSYAVDVIRHVQHNRFVLDYSLAGNALF